MSNPSARTAFERGTGPAARVTAYTPRDPESEPTRSGRWWQHTHEVTQLTIGHRQRLSITRGGAATVSATPDESSWTMALTNKLISRDHLLLAYRPPDWIDGVHVPGGWRLRIGRPGSDPTNPIWLRFWSHPDWRRHGRAEVVPLHDPLLAIVLPYARSGFPSAMLTIETTPMRAVPSMTRVAHDDARTPHATEAERLGILPAKQRHAVIAVFAEGLAWPPAPPRPTSGAPMGMRVPRWKDMPARISENWRAALRSKKYGTLLDSRPHPDDLPLMVDHGLLTYGSVYAALTVTEPGESYREVGDKPEFVAPHLENVPFLCRFR